MCRVTIRQFDNDQRWPVLTLLTLFMVFLVNVSLAGKPDIRCPHHDVVNIGERTELKVSNVLSKSKVIISRTDRTDEPGTRSVDVYNSGREKTGDGYSVTVVAEADEQQKEVVSIVLAVNRTDFDHAGVYQFEVDEVVVCRVNVNVVSGPRCGQNGTQTTTCGLFYAGPMKPRLAWTQTDEDDQCSRSGRDRPEYGVVRLATCDLEPRDHDNVSNLTCFASFNSRLLVFPTTTNGEQRQPDDAKDLYVVHSGNCSLWNAATTTPTATTENTATATTTTTNGHHADQFFVELQTLLKTIKNILVVLCVMVGVLIVAAAIVCALLCCNFGLLGVCRKKPSDQQLPNGTAEGETMLGQSTSSDSDPQQDGATNIPMGVGAKKKKVPTATLR